MYEDDLEFERRCKEAWKNTPLRERIKIRLSGFIDDVVFSIWDIFKWLFFDEDDDGNKRVPGASIILYLSLAGVLAALVIVNVSKRLC